MKTREQAVRTLAQTAEDKMLLQQFFDKYEVSQERSYLTHTRFLDLRERRKAAPAKRLFDKGEIAKRKKAMIKRRITF